MSYPKEYIKEIINVVEVAIDYIEHYDGRDIDKKQALEFIEANKEDLKIILSMLKELEEDL